MLQQKSTMSNATLRWANNGHVLICSQQCITPHLNVSGPNNAKADYANWGYRGHCNVTMAPSWLDCVCLHLCVCVFKTHPLGSPPPLTNAFPKTPVLQSLCRGLIIEAVVNWKVKGQGRGSDWSIPPGLINQLVFSFPPMRMQAHIKTKEWEGKERQKELGW